MCLVSEKQIKVMYKSTGLSSIKVKDIAQMSQINRHPTCMLFRNSKSVRTRRMLLNCKICKKGVLSIALWVILWDTENVIDLREQIHRCVTELSEKANAE